MIYHKMEYRVHVSLVAQWSCQHFPQFSVLINDQHQRLTLSENVVLDYEE